MYQLSSATLASTCGLTITRETADFSSTSGFWLSGAEVSRPLLSGNIKSRSMVGVVCAAPSHLPYRETELRVT
ncbi:MAG TPA: hypothetical protein VE056_08385, partial [Pyrinomonadaceae bacterium]|nr:hypothetical protein [Pyrinomonadaceae bacterium]